MFKKTLLAVLLAGVSCSSFANWVGGIGYTNLSADEEGIDVSLGAITGSIGYKIDTGNQFYLVPELRIGTGVKDDEVSVYGVDVDVEVDGFVAFSLRGQYDFNNNVYVYAAPSYANLELTVSASLDGQSFSTTNDEWEFGFGAGAGYQFTDTTAAELSYERFDEVDVISLGVKFEF